MEWLGSSGYEVWLKAEEMGHLVLARWLQMRDFRAEFFYATPIWWDYGCGDSTDTYSVLKSGARIIWLKLLYLSHV